MMRKISDKAITFIIVMLLVAASCPYMLSALMSMHGNHLLQTSLRGNVLKVTLHHVNDDFAEDHGHSHHSHNNEANHSAHHEDQDSSSHNQDHVVVISANQITTTSPLTIKAQKILPVVLPVSSLCVPAFPVVKNHNFFAISRRDKPPGYLAYHRTIVLHI